MWSTKEEYVTVLYKHRTSTVHVKSNNIYSLLEIMIKNFKKSCSGFTKKSKMTPNIRSKS